MSSEVKLSPTRLKDVLEAAGLACWQGRLPADLGSPQNHVFLLDDCVLKVFTDAQSSRPAREREALRLLRDSECRVPQLRRQGRLPSGEQWIVTTRLPGTAAPDFYCHQADEEISASLARQMGAQAARLHRVRAPGFGTWFRDPGITLIDEHRQRVRAVSKIARQAGIVNASTLDRIEAKFSELEDSLASAPKMPVLVHRDYQPRNVLVDKQGQLTGVVDFESAGGGDPADDFSRVALGWTGCLLDAFSEAYVAAGGVLGADCESRVAYHVLYWAVHITGYVAQYWPEFLKPAEQAIERILAGELPEIKD